MQEQFADYSTVLSVVKISNVGREFWHVTEQIFR